MKNREILDSLVENYSTYFSENRYSKEEMPLLDAMFIKMSNLFGDKNIKMSDITLVACQHLLTPQVNLFTKFTQIGFNPKNIFILPKAYSYNEQVSMNLKNLGCTVLDSANDFNLSDDFDVFHKGQVKKICDLFQKNISATSKVLILDDGGLLIQTINQDAVFMNKYRNQVFAVEQTNGGKNILLKKELKVFTTSVASSREKLEIETNYIIRLAIERIYEYFNIYDVSYDAKILILGKGTIGTSLFHSLQSDYKVFAYDIEDGNNPYCLHDFDIIIGATGTSSLSRKELLVLRKGVHLISVSSSDREFPASFLRRKSIGKNIHDDFHADELDIYLANGGFPITFKGNECECSPLEMDVTMMKLFEEICNHIICERNYKNSIIYLLNKKEKRTI